MELREYVSVRRAYNLVRQNVEATERLAFPELAILCHLHVSDGVLSTANIASYQKALRPTMTHRTKHLASLGLMVRQKGDDDRRNVMCKITEQGRRYVEKACEEIRGILHLGNVLSRTSKQRVIRYVDTMGTVSCSTSDLVVLYIYLMGDGHCTVGEMATGLGSLQPTTSMAVSKLERADLIVRTATNNAHSATFDLTESGRALARSFEKAIGSLVVKRNI